MKMKNATQKTDAEKLMEASKRINAAMPTTKEIAKNIAAAGRIVREKMPTEKDLVKAFKLNRP